MGSLLLGLAVPARAQTGTPAQPTPEQIRAYVASFEANVNKGCVQSKPQVANVAAYCRCYAASFVKRYSPNELAAMNNLAGQSPQAVQMITLMMSPERRACEAVRR